jgi:hypothetical protein
MQKNLSSEFAVLLDIKNIQRKKETLQLIRSFKNVRNVKILFSCTNIENIEQMIWLTNDMLPFYLPNEINNILDDAIDQYEKESGN